VSINIYLWPGSGADVYLRPDRSWSIDVYLAAGAPNPADVYLRQEGRPNIAAVAAPSFPTQYAGLRFYKGTVQELCLVALADAPTGNQIRIRKGGTDYAAYLVDTSDGNASAVRVRTSAGTKAIRLKT
jgi:hypothetical protein